jgi:hypothetical protein
LSRFRIFAVFAAVAVLAGVIAACGGGSDRSGEDPQKIVESATLKGIESGELELSVQVASQGKKSGNLEIKASGPFRQGAKGQPPQLALEASAHGKADDKPVDFEGGLTLLSDRAFVNYKGTEYEVDPTTFGFLKSAIEQTESQGGQESAAGATACQKAAEGIDVSQFVDHLSNEGSAEVDGTSTTEISGELNPAGAADAVVKLAEDPACASQLQAAGALPLGELQKAKSEVAESIKRAPVKLYVGDDDIIRKVSAEVEIEPKGKKGETVELDLDLSLGKVNEEVTIPTPSGAKPLELLFRKLGVNPLELLQGGTSGGIGGLLEGLGGAVTGPSSGGGSSGGASGGAASRQSEYAECLQAAESASDIQNCASLLK